MNAGIIQALFNLGLSKYRIAQLTGKSKQYIGIVCNGQNGVKNWDERKDQKNLIREAKQFLKEVK